MTRFTYFIISLYVFSLKKYIVFLHLPIRKLINTICKVYNIIKNLLSNYMVFAQYLILYIFNSYLGSYKNYSMCLYKNINLLASLSQLVVPHTFVYEVLGSIPHIVNSGLGLGHYQTVPPAILGRRKKVGVFEMFSNQPSGCIFISSRYYF